MRTCTIFVEPDGTAWVVGCISGGLGGGGAPTTATTTTTQELSPEQQQLISLVIPTAEQIIKEPPTQFPGSAIAPFDPLQVQAQENVLQLAGPEGPLTQFSNQAQMAGQFLLGPVLFPESNPALQAAVDAAVRPLTENFQNVVLPGIRGEAITAGGFGGSRQGIAEGLAAQGLTRSIGDVSAGIQANAFQQSLDAMVKALFAAPQTAQLPFTSPGAIEAVGAQRRALEQAQLSEEAQRFISEQLIPFATAQDVAALAFGLPGGQITSTSTLPGGESDALSQFLGLAGLALPLFGAGPSTAFGITL